MKRASVVPHAISPGSPEVFYHSIDFEARRFGIRSETTPLMVEQGIAVSVGSSNALPSSDGWLLEPVVNRVLTIR